MPTIHIIVQREIEKLLIETLLTDLPDVLNIHLHVAGMRSALHSHVRSIQVNRKKPAVLVVDADSTEEDAILQQKTMYKNYLNYTSYGIPFTIIQMIPTIEIIFFQSPSIIEQLLNVTLSPRDLIAGKFAPRPILESYLEEAGLTLTELIAKLDETHLHLLRKAGPVQELRAFVEGCLVRV